MELYIHFYSVIHLLQCFRIRFELFFPGLEAAIYIVDSGIIFFILLSRKCYKFILFLTSHFTSNILI